MVYLGSCSGKYYGLDAYTGDVLWEYDTVQDGGTQSFHGDALVTTDLVVVGSDGVDRGGVYAFERNTGIVRWRYDAGRGVTSDIVRAGQQVFAVTLKDDLICLQVTSGELAWRFKSGWEPRVPDRSVFRSTPVVVDGVVFFGGRNGDLFALNARTGKRHWTRKLGKRITTSVAPVGESIVVGTSDDLLFRIDRATGETKNKLKLGGHPFGTIITGRELLMLFSDWMKPNSAVLAVDRGLGRVRWRVRSPEPQKWITARPFLSEDRLFVGTDGGEIHALRLSDGSRELVGAIAEDVRVFGAADGMFYVGTIEGLLYGCTAP